MSPDDGAVDARVRVFVQTRGSARATDYAFLGGASPQPWWRAYRDATAFEHPTVLVTSDGARFRAYLSGIPSARVDAVGTVVRYTLVLDGPCGATDAACTTAAVAAWLDDVADGVGAGRLSAALDARFPPDDVQRWLATDAPAGEVRTRTLAALAALPADALPAADGADGADGADAASGTSDVPNAAFAPSGVGADGPGDWVGAVAAPAARAAFTARVAALVAGAPGRALLLNLVGGADDAATLVEAGSPVAVLVESTDLRLSRPTALHPVVEAKKAPAPPRAVPVRRAAAAGVAAAPLMLAVGVLVGLVVTVLVVGALLLLR